MLRITLIREEHSVKLKLEGKLGGPWVDELKNTWISLKKTSDQALIVDLNDLTSMDAKGEALLREMRTTGIVLLAETPYIRQKLRRITVEGKDADRSKRN